MVKYQFPEKEEWTNLAQRPVFDPSAHTEAVRNILDQIRENGDKALLELTRQFDAPNLDQLIVPSSEFDAAEAQLDPDLKAAILKAKENIHAFHAAQRLKPARVETQQGVTCWRKEVPIQRVGLYIPGGSAPLFSSILMLAVPAAIAGCREIVMCTPPSRDGSVDPAMLFTARLCGVEKVIRAGGAQAVAAMAYGTETVPKVDKIFGPGNQFVTTAKQIVASEDTAIDLPAGPSEVLVIADQTAVPEFVAADLLSQAEHGTDSQVILLTDQPALCDEILVETERQLANLPRKDIAREALHNSKAIVLRDLRECVSFSNLYAPEHLIISTEDPEGVAEDITEAGSVFLGHYTPESAGDYASGTNHTLPTNGFARAYSGVSLQSFTKTITFQSITGEGLRNLGPLVEVMAAAEQLEAHKRAVTVRLNKLKQNQ